MSLRRKKSKLSRFWDFVGGFFSLLGDALEFGLGLIKAILD